MLFVLRSRSECVAGTPRDGRCDAPISHQLIEQIRQIKLSLELDMLYINIIFSTGWKPFQARMEEAFGEGFHDEFRKLTLEEPPGRHNYRPTNDDDEDY